MNVLRFFSIGLVVYVWRGPVKHTAITVGYDEWQRPLVVDLEPQGLDVRLFQNFHNGQTVYVEHYPNSFSPEVIVDRALHELVSNRHRWAYHARERNCQIFTAFCATGQGRSEQIEALDQAIVGLATIAAAALFQNLVHETKSRSRYL